MRFRRGNVFFLKVTELVKGKELGLHSGCLNFVFSSRIATLNLSPARGLLHLCVFFVWKALSPDIDIDSLFIFQCCFLSAEVPEPPVEHHKSVSSPFKFLLLLYFSPEHSIIPCIF